MFHSASLQNTNTYMAVTTPQSRTRRATAKRIAGRGVWGPPPRKFEIKERLRRDFLASKPLFLSLSLFFFIFFFLFFFEIMCTARASWPTGSYAPELSIYETFRANAEFK